MRTVLANQRRTNSPQTEDEMILQRIWALLLQRCPVCLQGKVFNSLFSMYKSCPHCGVLFDRETGYYLNAMFFAYTIGFLIMIPTAIYLVMRDVSIAFFSIAIIVEIVLLWPLIFRYSRLLWLHIDQMMDPRTSPISDENPR